jgi:WD40 repeat protein
VDAPQVFTTVPGFKRIVSSVQFSPSGETLLAVGHRGCPKARDNYDRVLNLWDSETGRVKATLNPDHDIRCACFSPDGQFLAVGGAQPSSGRESPQGEVTVWMAANQ